MARQPLASSTPASSAGIYRRTTSLHPAQHPSHQQVFLKELALHCDYKMDESYTPNKVSIRVGTSFSDLREVKTLDLTEPQGWVIIPLMPEDDPE
jgi:hypothetical protein